jgi:ferritin-like metal-binding protein YciE
METQRKKATAATQQKNAAHGLRDLFAQDIYYAEKTLSKTLNMKNASTPQLATSINNHLKERTNRFRLEKIFEVTGIKPTAKKSMQWKEY